MEQRKMVTDFIDFPIGDGMAEDYKKEFTWEDLLKTKNILPTDIVWHFFYKKEKESGLLSMKTEDELEYYYLPVIQIKRQRPETDEEYLARQRSEQQNKNQSEEKERLEYLRLKAKFEPQQTEKQ